MSLLGFGQPQTGILQMAYVVEDIDASMQRWIEQLNVGPWFLLPHFTGERATYRGEPAEADVALAMAYAGHMLVELIQPNDDKPSVYREAIDRRGYGFHHFGVGSLDYDAGLVRHREQGHELAFEAWVPTGGRVAYVDTTAELPGYVEVIELDAATDAAFTRLYGASLAWDGSDPVRPFGPACRPGRSSAALLDGSQPDPRSRNARSAHVPEHRDSLGGHDAQCRR
jgi:hypothetical protein